MITVKRFLLVFGYIITIIVNVIVITIIIIFSAEINPQTDVIFFTNPQLIISDRSVFDVPAVCTSGTVVG